MEPSPIQDAAIGQLADDGDPGVKGARRSGSVAMAASDMYSVDARSGATIAPLMCMPFNEDRKLGGARLVDHRTLI